MRLDADLQPIPPLAPEPLDAPEPVKYQFDAGNAPGWLLDIRDQYRTSVDREMATIATERLYRARLFNVLYGSFGARGTSRLLKVSLSRVYQLRDRYAKATELDRKEVESD